MLEAATLLSAQYYSKRQNSDNVELAEVMARQTDKFAQDEHFKEAVSTITVFVLRSKEFSRADAVIQSLGLPCDPSVCLT
mmetsp:Transcript_57009/g.124023  ORF Transcript_57009/g.124023 Transcript_57009/m.124023 type:complete len:80 (-) Transcript_57009:1933-2172(-)